MQKPSEKEEAEGEEAEEMLEPHGEKRVTRLDDGDELLKKIEDEKFEMRQPMVQIVPNRQ